MARRTPWPRQHVITRSHEDFTVSKVGDLTVLVADVSDVAPYEIPGGFRVKGRRKVVQFDLHRVVRDTEGDILMWQYRCAPTSPELVGVVLHIFND